MATPKRVNLLVNSCSSAMSHLSLTVSRIPLFSAKLKRHDKHSVNIKTLFVFVFLLLQAGSFLFAQEWEIRGKVTSAEDGSALAFANIEVKGTTRGTTADIDGIFRLKANKGDTLVVSIVGYAKREVAVADQSFLNVSLRPEAWQLKAVEVVGIGYGQVKKSDATGSIAAISAKDFDKGAITSPQDLLIGKLPGVVVSTLGGAAGAGTKIRIRGGASITANNDPLVVIDGIPLESAGISGMANPLSTINPNDIESVTVLKDASATAIYGSRASNGVIIITTKRGTVTSDKQPMKIHYTGNFSLGAAEKFLSVFDGNQFRALIADRVANYGLSAVALNRLGTANTDWQKEIYQTAPETEHNLSISHAIGSVPYRLSLDYLYQDGILKYNNIDRKNVSLAVTPTLLNGDLSIDLNGFGSWISNNFSNNDAISAAVQYDPTQPVKNGNSRYGGYTTWTLL